MLLLYHKILLNKKTTIFNLSTLIKAYLSCRKSKRKSFSSLQFELDFERRLLKLSRQLQNKTYQIGKYYRFILNYPKIREVYAPSFRDRLTHHLLINHIEPIFEPKFIHHSYACRKNKGPLKAKEDISNILTTSADINHYAQFDIRSFFVSIDKNILYRLIKKQLNNSDLLWLANKIIFHNPSKNYQIIGDKEKLKQVPPHKKLSYVESDKGLPIGNLTSQFFANIYLNQLDRYIKRELKINHYFRYADDMLLLANDIKKLKQTEKKISRFANSKLNLTLHPDKTKYGQTKNGIDFCGYIIHPNHSLIRKRTVNNFKQKLYYFNQGRLIKTNNQKQISLPLQNPPTSDQLKDILATVNSYYGLFRQANSHNLRKDLYENHFGMLKKYLKPINKYKYFKIKKRKEK